MFKQAVLSFICFVCPALQASTVEVDLLGKLDTIEEHVADPDKRLQAKYTLIEIMAKCEFDEQCILNKKEEIDTLAKQQKNLMYVAFLKYLDWEKSDLEFNIKNCQSDEKKAVRKVYAKCYLQWIEAEKSHPPQNRQEIDVLENQRRVCIREGVTPLAEQNNIFAQAELVNLAEHFRQPAEVTKWSDKISAINGTSKYMHYMKCSEIP